LQANTLIAGMDLNIFAEITVSKEGRVPRCPPVYGFCSRSYKSSIYHSAFVEACAVLSTIIAFALPVELQKAIP